LAAQNYAGIINFVLIYGQIENITEH
jgi:hypothetical protein